MRRNFLWSLAGNVSYAASQWGVFICLAKFGSPQVVPEMIRGGIQTWLMQVLRLLDCQRFQMDCLVPTSEPCDDDEEIRALGSKIIPCPRARHPLRYARQFRKELARAWSLRRDAQPPVGDLRDSPAFPIMDQLVSCRVQLRFNDPHVPELIVPRRFSHVSSLNSQPLTHDFLREQDAGVIVADHSSYDWPWIVEHSSFVIDTRNATRDLTTNRDRLIRA